MGKFTKKITETNIRIGEVRFSYANVFVPRKSDDSADGKYRESRLLRKKDEDFFLLGLNVRRRVQLPPSVTI